MACLFFISTSKMHFVLVASLVACAFAAPSEYQQQGLERIVGGQQASKGQFPHQLSLQYKSGGIVFSHVCGAVAISPSWSLTAAQCRDSFDLSRYRIVAGLLNQGENTADVQIRSIEEFILHPEYRGGRSTNDIALLLHSEPLSWTDAVQPAKLPKPSGSDPSGDATLSSWGSGTALQWASLPVLSHDDCASALTSTTGSLGPFDNTQTCTGSSTGEKSGCNDDLGSPLVQNGNVIGLVSWAVDPCGTKGAPTVYTRTDSHNDFILQYVHDISV